MTTPSGLPRINEPAPDFKVNTTHGERSLADYKGKWLVLFSHPADFTPVCTTEFIGFAKAADTFKAMNCELLGLSIDSIYSHLAWMQSIKNNFGVEITFPIIDDIKMEVAQAYGMIQRPLHRRVCAPAASHADQRRQQDCHAGRLDAGL